MADSIIYLLIMFLFIFIVFFITKMPLYNIMALCFVLMLIVTKTYTHVFDFIKASFSTSLLYVIFCFLMLSQLLVKTGVINDCINVVISIFGRIPGGAGYVSIISSAFMGAISGSGPGNVAATGVITIPAMKRSGFPAHLAANVEAAASTLGNMIPPSGVIIASYGCYQLVEQDDSVSIGKFWLVLWGISFWFIVQRIVTLLFFCKYYKVEPVDKNEIKPLKQSLRDGWKNLFLPVIIIFPFVFEYFFGDSFIANRIGSSGASALSSCILLFVPGITALFVVLISKDKSFRKVKNICNVFSSSVKSVVPTLVTLIFAYSIGEIFSYIGVAEDISNMFLEFEIDYVGVAFIIPLFTMILGMVFPGSAQITIFGSSLLLVMINAGLSPILGAAMLPCICGAMSGIVPPVAVCTLTAAGIAESNMTKTMKNSMIWVLIHYFMSVAMLLGILPVWGC